MSWELYGQARAALDNGDAPKALVLIEGNRSEFAEIASHFAVLEAQCHARLGQIGKAISILEKFATSIQDNYWVFYNLAQLYRQAGDLEKTFVAYRRAHALLGWTESERNGYALTHDYFSPNIPAWETWFAARITRPRIRCLEIGSWQGGSAVWLLDKIVAPRHGSLTCIDTFEGSSEHSSWLHQIGDSLENLFDSNIAKSGHQRLCRKLVGFSQSVLRTLYQEEFDFIYVDGAHEAKYVIEDAILSWGLLPEGGFILFDDLDYRFPNAPQQNTMTAIQAFLDWFAEDLEVVAKTRQLLIRKLSKRQDKFVGPDGGGLGSGT